MEIEIFTVADHAQVLQGKLIIVGTFDTLWAKQVPTKHPSCSVALRLRFAESEVGKHTMNLKFQDPNNKEIANINGEIDVRPPNPGVSYNGINFAINFANLELKEVGRYNFVLFIDGEWRSAIPLSVVKQQQQA